MHDADLRLFMRQQLMLILPRMGLEGVQVVASNQSNTEGRETGPVIYFHQLDEQQEGYPYTDVQEIDVDTASISERQIYVTPFQISAFAPEGADLSQPTATDICRAASMALQSRQFVDALKAVDNRNGVRRISAIRRPYIVNDRGQFEMSPSFDVSITHTVQFTRETEVVKSIEVRTLRV